MTQRKSVVGVLCAALLLHAQGLLAAPHESSTDPLPNEQRALTSLRIFSTGPWVQGDWALKCMMSTGKKQEKVGAGMEVIGGWSLDTGRWQRVRLPNGRQWLVISKSDITSPEELPAAPLPPPTKEILATPRPGKAPVATLILSDGTQQPVYAPATSSSSATPSPVSLKTQSLAQVSSSASSSNNLNGGINAKISAKADEVSFNSPEPNPKEIPASDIDEITGDNLVVGLNTPHEATGNSSIGRNSSVNSTSSREDAALLPFSTLMSLSQDTSASPRGPRSSQIWELSFANKTGSAQLLSPAERAQPMLSRIGLDWNLFLMDFLNAPEVHYKGVERLRARWCDVVELVTGREPYARALVWIDVEFGAPVEAALYNANGELLKTVRAVSVQKVDNDWILRRWEILDAATHAKITLEVVAVALKRQWSAKLYTPSSQVLDWPQIPFEDWKDFEQQ